MDDLKTRRVAKELAKAQLVTALDEETLTRIIRPILGGLYRELHKEMEAMTRNNAILLNDQRTWIEERMRANHTSLRNIRDRLEILDAKLSKPRRFPWFW